MGDLRYALRALRRDWGFTLTFVLTLGLGIGANTAIFSLVNGVLLRPLPYPESDRIVRIAQPARGQGIADLTFSFAEAEDLREQSETLEHVVEYGDWTFNVLGRGDPHRVTAGLVTANFFQVLGMQPLHGRLLAEEDRGRTAPPVVVLAHDYWQETFGGDPGVVGELLDLTESSATIVGVLAPGAHYATARDLDLYANYASNDHYSGAAMQDERAHRMTELFGRLAPTVGLDAARAEVGQIWTRLAAAYPEAYPAEWDVEVQLRPWREYLVEEARSTLLILLGTAFFVLVIACANVGNLTLTRLVRRDRELAVRRALGGSPWRVRRLLILESSLVAAAGALLGLALAYVGLDALIAYTERFTSRTGEIGIDVTVLAFTLIAGVVVALLFGMAPLPGHESRLAESLSAGGGHATAGRQRRFLQRLLVVGQVATCFILLVGAGLLLRTLANLYAVDPGFDLDNVLTLQSPKFGDYSLEGERQFADAVIEQVGAHPGVTGVALVGSSPLGNTAAWPMQFRTYATPDDASSPAIPTVYETVTHGYFETLGLEVLRGRGIERQDIEGSERVAVLNQAMARHYFGDEDPLGRQIAYSWGGPYSDWFTVVGIAADARLTDVRTAATHAFYVSFYQEFPGSTVLIRTAQGPAGIVPHVVDTIRKLDPERPVEGINTLAELHADTIAPQRLNATLFLSFALLALAIALVGIAGVLAFSVSQRGREMGIRQALGASRWQVLDLVLREGVFLTLAGVVAGFFGALYVARFLATLLYEVRPLDAPTFVAVAFVLVAVGLVGAWIPARRAARVHPIDALRAE